MYITHFQYRVPLVPHAGPGCDSHRVEEEGTDWSRAKSRMRPLAPQGGVTRPEDTQKGAPSRHPEIFLGTHLPSSPFESSAALRTEGWAESSPSVLLWASGADGAGGREPLERKPPGKTSKCFTNKSGPFHRTCPRSGTS